MRKLFSDDVREGWENVPIQLTRHDAQELLLGILRDTSSSKIFLGSNGFHVQISGSSALFVKLIKALAPDIKPEDLVSYNVGHTGADIAELRDIELIKECMSQISTIELCNITGAEARNKIKELELRPPLEKAWYEKIMEVSRKNEMLR